MGQAGPLRWRDGRGWIVLIGGGELKNIQTIHRAAIDMMTDESPLVFIPTASSAPDGNHDANQRIIAQIEACGGPTGYVAPIFTRTDATDLKNARRLAQAGIIYLGDGQTQRLIKTLNSSPTLDALTAAYEAGAIVIAEGETACVLGTWVVCETEMTGWGWLPDALICPHFSEPSILHKAIRAHPACLGLGIPENTALALGPDNQVQTLSANGKQVTVVLGPHLRPPSPT